MLSKVFQISALHFKFGPKHWADSYFFSTGSFAGNKHTGTWAQSRKLCMFAHLQWKSCHFLLSFRESSLLVSDLVCRSAWLLLVLSPRYCIFPKLTSFLDSILVSRQTSSFFYTEIKDLLSAQSFSTVLFEAVCINI